MSVRNCFVRGSVVRYVLVSDSTAAGSAPAGANTKGVLILAGNTAPTPRALLAVHRVLCMFPGAMPHCNPPYCRMDLAPDQQAVTWHVRTKQPLLLQWLHRQNAPADAGISNMCGVLLPTVCSCRRAVSMLSCCMMPHGEKRGQLHEAATGGCWARTCDRAGVCGGAAPLLAPVQCWVPGSQPSQQQYKVDSGSAGWLPQGSSSFQT